MKDLALKLNVSIATVSRAMQNHPGISQERKKQVWALAKKLDYQPDSVAQSLKSRTTSTLGVIVPEIKHNFFSAALDGIEEVAYKAGFTLLVCKSNEDSEREEINANLLVSKRVTGLIVSLAQNSKNPLPFSNLIKKNIPIVFFDRVFEGLVANKVVVNDYDAAFRMTEYLMQKGYKRIAHLAGFESVWIGKERCRGYRDALLKHHRPVNENLIIPGGFDTEDGQAGYQKLMQQKPKPDAVFTVNDPVALGVYLACKRDGIRIPQDLAVAGFSDNPISALLDPPLTTISQPAYEMGMMAAELLLNQIQKKNKVKSLTKICETKLVIRQST